VAGSWWGGCWLRRGNRVLRVVFGTGLLALLAGLVLLAVILRTQGVQRAATWASVVSTSLAIAGALVTLVTWWLRPAAEQPSSSADVRAGLRPGI
jgi:Kef-type K+ transport system membrane component KefB